jgi:hypothetical protein
MDKAEAYDPPGLPLPTVAHDRGHGITSLRVHCAAGLVCPNSKIFTLELRLTDDMTIMHIPRHRRFVCMQCGSRKVTVRSVWPDRRPTRPFYNPSMSGVRAGEVLRVTR